MSILKKLSKFFVPSDVDYFGELSDQSKLTGNIVRNLKDIYTQNPSEDIQKINSLIENAKEKRKERLIELNKAFITPVDKEAISRVYSSLYWIDLSIKHLIIGTDTYQINNLSPYAKILKWLVDEIENLNAGFNLLNKKKFDDILKKVEYVIHLDNILIKEYTQQLWQLFNKNEISSIVPQKEILSQLKEISKRMHFCANQLEDIVFKMN